TRPEPGRNSDACRIDVSMRSQPWSRGDVDLGVRSELPFCYDRAMRRRHVIVSGTGRAGTTFLIQLFTHLGLDTGFDVHDLEVDPRARAGLERDIRDTNAPYIVKSPFYCDVIDEMLASSVRIAHAIVPVRQFDAAAASRAYVQRLTTGG